MPKQNEHEQMQKLALQWKAAAPLLRAQRHKDIRRQNNAESIMSFDSFFRYWIKKNRPSKTSGFLQMYEVLKRRAEGLITMLSLFHAAHELQSIFDKKRWKYCFIGGVAVQKWGQARFTKDIDLTLFSGYGGEAAFVDDLLSRFKARIPNPREFAIQNRILLLSTTDGIGIDVSLGGFPFEQSAIARAKKVLVVPGIRLKLCTAEDLIVYKAFANRPIDWMDVEGIIAKQLRKKLDWNYVFKHLQTLAELKFEPEIVAKLRELKREVGS